MFLKRFALVLAGFAIACALGEMAVRYLTRFHETAPPMFATAPDMPWQLKPGATAMHAGYWGEFRVPIAINSLGYREGEFSIARAPEVCRILVLGDSFTFGHGVRIEEAYAKVLERTLNAQAATRRYEVINAGYASGYAPDTALVYFRHHGIALRPDIVLLGFFEGNDIADEADTAWDAVDEHGWPTKITNGVDYIDSQGRLRSAAWLGMAGAAMPKARPLAAAKVAVRDHSELVNFLLQQYRLRTMTIPSHPVGATPPADDRDLATSADSADLAAEAKTRRSLDGLRDWTRRAGATLAVISIPEKGARQAGALLRAWAAGINTPLIDLGAAGDGDAGLYFQHDGHWTPAGQARAGAHVAGALQRQGVLNVCLARP